MSQISIKSFVNNDLIQFSKEDNIRSIPELMDGFKDSQRKAFYGISKISNNAEIKVAQAAGHCALVSHYEHGETSMGDTIVGLAQRFPGCNNVNLFEPIGQFGSILDEGASAHRYIYTKMSPNASLYFKEDDKLILEYNDVDGERTEPVMYYPTIPMWAINGSVGIGTGHSVKILPRDPEKLKKAILLLLGGKAINEKLLTPYFIGWGGSVEKIKDTESSWLLTGCFERINSTKIKITELPLYNLEKYKGILNKLVEDKVIKDYDNNSTEEGFEFILDVPRSLTVLSDNNLANKLKLVRRITENVTLWQNKVLKKFDNASDALSLFVKLRLDLYNDRKEALLSKLESEISFLEQKLAFIELWVEHQPYKQTEAAIVKLFKCKVTPENTKRFLSLPVKSLTEKQVSALKSSLKKLNTDKERVYNSTALSFYKKDLT